MSSRKALTKDEKLLLELEAQDTEEGVVPEVIAAKIGISPKACRTIMVLLGQANFIKKLGPNHVRITELGKSLCDQLKNSV